MTDRKIFIHPEAFTEEAFETAAYRYSDGFAGAFFTLTQGLIVDSIQQLIQDLHTFPMNKLGPDYFPSDYAGQIGQNFGILKYPIENLEQYKARLSNKWNFVRDYSQIQKLQTVLEDSLQGTYTVQIKNKVQGEQNTIPRPKSAGIDIQPYPYYGDNPFQFNVYITFQAVIGSGLYSNIVSDEDFAYIRETIRLIKPITWACREIVFILNPDNTALWDDGLHEWDDGLLWGDGSSSNFAMERHSYQQRLI